MQLQDLPAGNRTRVLWINTRPVLYHWATEAVLSLKLSATQAQSQTQKNASEPQTGIEPATFEL